MFEVFIKKKIKLHAILFIYKFDESEFWCLIAACCFGTGFVTVPLESGDDEEKEISPRSMKANGVKVIPKQEQEVAQKKAALKSELEKLRKDNENVDRNGEVEVMVIPKTSNIVENAPYQKRPHQYQEIKDVDVKDLQNNIDDAQMVIPQVATTTNTAPPRKASHQYERINDIDIKYDGEDAMGMVIPEKSDFVVEVSASPKRKMSVYDEMTERTCTSIYLYLYIRIAYRNVCLLTTVSLARRVSIDDSCL